MAATSGRFVLCWACLIFCFPCSLTAEYVPVFIWESSSDIKPVEVPALAKMQASEFKDIVSDRLQRQDVIVVFMEENLSVEDFSWQDTSGQGSYPHLQKVAVDSEGVTYLPSVHSPLRVLRSLPGDKWQHVSLSTEGLKPDMKWNETGLIIVSLVDAAENEDRPHLLRRHDLFMTKIYDQLMKKHSHVTAIYTAHHPSWSEKVTSSRGARSKRETEDGILYNGNDRIYLYTLSIPVLVLEKTPITLGDPISVIALNVTEENLLDQLQIEYPQAKLTFSFTTTSGGYWGLQEVIAINSADASMKEHKLYSDVVEAPIGWSYHCSQSVVFKGVNKTDGVPDSYLTFDSMQVQPLLSEVAAGETPKFGDSWDCVYFFTAPILSGILITILFAWIMGFGICMIMDIKTMDRFDDPKGKAINVNVSE